MADDFQQERKRHMVRGAALLTLRIVVEGWGGWGGRSSMIEHTREMCVLCGEDAPLYPALEGLDPANGGRRLRILDSCVPMVDSRANG